MSRRALAIAARDILRNPENHETAPGIGVNGDHCELAPMMGQPPPMCGEVFFGVWCSGRTNSNRGVAALDEYYQLTVTATFRLQGRTPFDRIGTARWGNVDDSIIKTGIDDAIDRIRVCLAADALDHRLIRAANKLLTFNRDDQSNFPTRGFCEPLRYLGDDSMIPVGPRWFNSRGERKDYGVKVDIRFGQARRLQKFMEDNGDPT